MKWTPLVVWILSVIFILIGITGLIAGAAGNSWWTIDNESQKNDVGLWRTCSQDPGANGAGFKDEVCYNRPNILEFKDTGNVYIDNREQDAVLLVLIISSVFAFFSFISIMSMLCCQQNIDGWKCGALITTLFTFISMICGLGALVFSEVELERLWNNGHDHGWSVILAWLGSSFIGLAFILSFMLMCVDAKDHESRLESYKHTNGHDRSGMAARGAHANRGYEMK